MIPPRITYAREGDVESARLQRRDAFRFLDIVQQSMGFNDLELGARRFTDLVTGRVIDCNIIKTPFGEYQAHANIYMPKVPVEPEVTEVYPTTGAKPYIMLVSGLYNPNVSFGPHSEPWAGYDDSRFRATGGSDCRYLVWDVIENEVAFGPGTEEELNEYGLHIAQVYKVNRFEVAERVKPYNREGNEDLFSISYAFLTAKQGTAYPTWTSGVHGYNCYFVKSYENPSNLLIQSSEPMGAMYVGPYWDTNYDETTYDFTRYLSKTWESQLKYDCSYYESGRDFFSGTKERFNNNWVYTSETEKEIRINTNYSWRYFPNMYIWPSTHKSRTDSLDMKVYHTYPDSRYYNKSHAIVKEPWYKVGSTEMGSTYYPQSFAQVTSIDWTAYTPLGEISSFNAVDRDYTVTKETPFLWGGGRYAHYTGENKTDWISHSIIMKGEYSQDVIANIFVHEVIPTEREYVDGDYNAPGLGGPDPLTNSPIIHKGIETHVQAGVGYFVDDEGRGTAQDRTELIVGRSSKFQSAVLSLVKEGQGSSMRDIEMRIFYRPAPGYENDCETCYDMGEDWPIDEVRAEQKAEAESL